MWAAVQKGDVKELAELIRQDPGFDVNMDHGGGLTLLHHTCAGNHWSSVIPILLTHPDIDVNVKNQNGCTPFYYGCGGRPSCVREILKDSRVNVNEPRSDGITPLCWAAANGYLDIIKWWIASGREIDLGTPGDVDMTDAVGGAKFFGKTEVVTLLKRFEETPEETRHAVRVELGWHDNLAAEMFALVVFISDEVLQVKDTTTPSPAARFFSIATRLTLELQMGLCYRVVGSCKEIIPGKDSEVAFKELAN